jgi:hypothetical protein
MKNLRIFSLKDRLQLTLQYTLPREKESSPIPTSVVALLAPF